MSVSDTYAKIVDLAGATTGIVWAPDELPLSLSEADLPCALTLVGSATWNEHAIGLYRQVRTYTVRTFVRAVGEGVEPDEGYKACLGPLQALGYTFVSNQTLDGLVDQVNNIRDGGVQNGASNGAFAYAGRAYYGFDTSFDVTEKGT